MEEKKVIANFGDFKIMSNTLYKVTGKKDTEAPRAYQERGISHAPFDGNAKVVYCLFDNIGRVYDTGFYTSSRCYSSWMNKKEIEEEVKLRKKYILDPFVKKTNEDVTQSNTEFWDNKGVKIFIDKFFNTADPIELFDLYVAVLCRGLTPKAFDGDPEYMDSMYCIEDRATTEDSIMTRRVKREDLSYEVVRALKGTPEERDNIINVMLYAGIIDNPTLTEDDYYKWRLSNWIESNINHLDKMWNTIERSKEKINKDMFACYKKLFFIDFRGRMQRTQDGYFIGNENIGLDLRSAASRITQSKAYTDTKLAIEELYLNLVEKDNLKEEKQEDKTEE